MSGLLDQREQLQLLQQEDPPQLVGGATLLEGSLSAPFAGIASGFQKTVLGGDAFRTEVLQPDPYAGTVLADEDTAAFDAERERRRMSEIQALRPDPATTGFAGQLLFGLTDVMSRFVAGGMVAGPLGGAALAGGSEGYAVTAEQIAAGVDPDTARAVGAVQGGAVAIGGLLPASLGVGTAAKVATGAGLNVTVGAVSRGTTAAVLESGGYTKQAEQFKWLDGQALLTDAVLGAGFGYWSSPHAATLGKRLFGETKPAPEQMAAAAVAGQQVHAEIATAPGIVVDATAQAAHADNLVRATEAVMRDEPVPAMRDVEVMRNPQDEQFRREMTRAADEIAERRSDPELRARIDDMAPEQRATEIEWLRKENDRLNNELRTDPLTGLGNKRAWAEIEANPSLPVKAMLDVDSLKWVNDNLGHEAGDAFLVQISEAIKRSGVENVARLGGDEFAFAARTPEAADAAAARVNEELAQVRVEATTPDGQVITKTGAGVSYGRGATRGEADAGLYRNKAERTAQGLRSERGTEPSGVSRQPAAGKQSAVPAAGAEDQSAGPGRVEPPSDGTPVNETARAAEDLGAAVADESAAEALVARPDMMITTEDGLPVSAAAALAEADAVVAQATQDANLFAVAAACFTRVGE